MQYLLSYRDRIAVENLQATGRLSKDEFVFPGAEEHYSLATLIDALFAGGKIDERSARQGSKNAAWPLDYFMKRRDVIGPKISILINKNIGLKKMQKLLGESRLTRLDDPTQTLSKDDISRVIYWGRWFLTNPEVVTRTLYTTEELGFMALLPPHFMGPRGLVPATIARTFESAARLASKKPAEARRQAVKGLQEIMDYYGTSEEPKISRIIARYLERLNRLMDWNLDTIKKMVRENIGKELSEIARSTLDRNVKDQERYAAVAVMRETLDILQRSFTASRVRKGERPDNTKIFATLWETYRVSFSDRIDGRWIDLLKYVFAKFVREHAHELGLMGTKELPKRNPVKKTSSKRKSYSGTPRPPTGSSSEDH